MADTTEGDTTVLDLGLLVPALIALIAGLLTHSFIIGVNVSDWWRGRSVTPVDLIVTALGITRVGAQSAVTLGLFLVTGSWSLESDVIMIILDTIYDFFYFWLTSLLSIVLCLKISNLHTRLFLYLRRMISHRTGRLIVASGILSAFSCSMTLLLAFTHISNSGAYNKSVNNHLQDCTSKNYLYSFTTGAIFPLLFYYISSVLLFFSLYHHTTRMKRSSNLSINLETYYSVMKLVSFTFLYNTLCFIGIFAGGLYYYYYSVDFPWICIVWEFLLPAVHSSYLIYRTEKLRNKMSKVLHNVMDFLFQWKGPGTTKNI